MDPSKFQGCYSNESVKFFYDISKKNISDTWRTKDMVVVGLGLSVCIFVIFANILVMMAIFMNRRFHYPIYYLLGNLAAADLFSGISYMYLMFHTGPWTVKLTISNWFVRQGLIDTSLTASVINLMAIALERHQTIFTMQLHSKMTSRRVVLLILGIWVVSVLMGLVPSMGWNCLCAVSECSTMAPLYSRSYMVFWAIVNLVSFSIMLAVYLRIFLYVRRKSQHMSQHTQKHHRRQTVLNLMKTVTMILGCFVVCWTPGLVLLLLDGLHINCDILTYEKFFLVLAECNSFMNPIIYSYRDQDMRETFSRILCCRSAERASKRSGLRFNTLEQEACSARAREQPNGVQLEDGENILASSET